MGGNSCGHHDEAGPGWLRDCPGRDDAQPWMLMKLPLAPRGLDRFKEANRVNRFAFQELVADYTSGFHELWLILDDALAGHEEAALEYFEKHRIEEHDPNHQWIATLARAILISLRNEPGAFAQARRFLVKAAANIKPIDRDMVFQANYKKAIGQIDKKCVGLTAGNWN